MNGPTRPVTPPQNNAEANKPPGGFPQYRGLGGFVGNVRPRDAHGRFRHMRFLNGNEPNRRQKKPSAGTKKNLRAETLPEAKRTLPEGFQKTLPEAIENPPPIASAQSSGGGQTEAIGNLPPASAESFGGSHAHTPGTHPMRKNPGNQTGTILRWRYRRGGPIHPHLTQDSLLGGPGWAHPPQDSYLGGPFSVHPPQDSLLGDPVGSIRHKTLI